MQSRGLRKTPWLIENVPEDTLLENTPIFNAILKRFNHSKNADYSIRDIAKDLYLLEEFDIFSTSLLFTKKLPVIVKKDQKDNVTKVIKSFKERFFYSIKSIDAYYVEVKSTVYPNNYSNKEEIDAEMKLFLSAYQTMKLVFDKKFREGKDSEGKYIRYFEHLKGVMEIVLKELPNPNIDKIIISLLHDAIEDIDGMTFEVIKNIYGEHIAKGVQALSKKSLEHYMSDFELMQIQKYRVESTIVKKIKEKAKDLRVEDYFGHMAELDNDILDVKFADRIHNLRTLDVPGMKKDKIIRKIQETEKYFLSLAKDRNITAYTIMLDEIMKLKKTFKIFVNSNEVYELQNGLTASEFHLHSVFGKSQNIDNGPENLNNYLGDRKDCISGMITSKKGSKKIYAFWNKYTGVCLWRQFFKGENGVYTDNNLQDYNINLVSRQLIHEE